MLLCCPPPPPHSPWAAGVAEGQWGFHECPLCLLCLLPTPTGLQAGLCRAELGSCEGSWRRNCRAQFPPQSHTVLSKPSQEREAFFSNDSAAREWEGLSPRLWQESHWPTGREREGGKPWVGVLPGTEGRGRVLGAGRQQEGWTGRLRLFFCTAESLPGGAKANGQEMEMGELGLHGDRHPVDSHSRVQ